MMFPTLLLFAVRFTQTISTNNIHAEKVQLDKKRKKQKSIFWHFPQIAYKIVAELLQEWSLKEYNLTLRKCWPSTSGGQTKYYNEPIYFLSSFFFFKSFSMFSVLLPKCGTCLCKNLNHTCVKHYMNIKIKRSQKPDLMRKRNYFMTWWFHINSNDTNVRFLKKQTKKNLEAFRKAFYVKYELA